MVLWFTERAGVLQEEDARLEEQVEAPGITAVAWDSPGYGAELCGVADRGVLDGDQC